MNLINTKKDIENFADIKKLVNDFYIKVVPDELIGPIFEKTETDWTYHLPKMYDFWDSVLFAKHSYNGNPMTRHFEIDQEIKFLPEHFTRWKELFYETVDEYFEGPIAIKAKEKAKSIAEIMERKIEMNRATSPLVPLQRGN